MTLPLAIGMPGPFEMIILAGLGLLIFGRRLPEVGRSIGQTVVQFKKGLNEVGEEMNKPGLGQDSQRQIPDQTAGYKFDPHTGEPINREPQYKFDPHTGEPIGKGEAVNRV